MTDFTFPQNLEAEEAVLGSMIMSPRAIEIVQDVGLRIGDFYRPSHQIVFDVVMELDGKQAVDELTVINELKRRGKMNELGGPVTIVSLTERVPAVSNCRAYAEEVRAQAVYRRLVDAGQQIARLGYEHAESPDDLVSAAAEIAANVGGDVDTGDESATFGDTLTAVYDDMVARHESGETISGLRTGFPKLDELTGGLQPGNVYVIAARPGMGKTALAGNIIDHIVVERGVPLHLFSLEMSRKEVVGRIIAARAKINSQRVNNALPLDSDFDAVMRATNEVRAAGGGKLVIDDSSSITSAEMRVRARRRARACERAGQPLGGIVVDYLQLARCAKRASNREQEVAHISRDLKAMARELHVPVLALSQIGRQSDNREGKRPQLSDLRESGAIEQDASVVAFIHRAEVALGESCPPDLIGKAELIIAKNRFGSLGSVYLGWLGKYTKFIALESNAAPAPPKPYAPGTGGVV